MSDQEDVDIQLDLGATDDINKSKISPGVEDDEEIYAQGSQGR